MRLSAWGAQPLQRYDTSQPDTVRTILKRDDNDFCLPSEVVAGLPTCAISCVQDFVANSFGSPSCTDSSNLNFLCTTEAQGGFTIGEGGLRCVLSNCSKSEAKPDVYFVCNGIAGAQPKTQSTITATVDASTTAKPPTRGTSTTSQSSTSSFSLDGGLATVTATTPLDLSTFGFVTADTPFPAPSSALSTASPSAAPAPAKSGLPPGQIAGIAVGSAVGAFGLLGLLLFFWFRSRRAQRSPITPGPGSSISPSSSNGLIGKSRQIDGHHEPFPPGLNPSPVATIAAAVEAAQAGIKAPIGVGVSRPSSISPPLTARQQVPTYWANNINEEEIGVAVSEKEGAAFVRKSQGSTIASRNKSMLPIPESSVLPAALSPATSTGAASEQFGERNSPATVTNFHMAVQESKDPWIQNPINGQTYVEEKIPVTSDVEGQEIFAAPPRGSFVSSVRASLVEFGAMLVRKVSLKRQPSDTRPLLKPGDPTLGRQQPVNKYPLTPKYDNGYFVPNPPLTSSTISPPDTAISPPPPLPGKMQRKPTFSSFVAGKLLPASGYTSPPSQGTRDDAENALTSGQPTGVLDPLAVAAKPSMQPSLARKMPPIHKRLVNFKSPGMMPAPLLIRKSETSKIYGSDMALETPYRELAYQTNSGSDALGQSTSGPRPSLIAQTPQKVMEIMGLAAPANIRRYSQKPLPAPKQEPNPFEIMPPLAEPNRPTAIDTLATVKAAQRQQEEPYRQEAEIPDPPLSAATSWLSVPASTPAVTPAAIDRALIMQRSPYSAAPLSSMQTPMDASPKGRPGFPSMAPSLSSIYTKYKYSTTQLPTITPTSAITLSAAKYKPPTQSTPPLPPLPSIGTPSSFLRDPSPLPGADPEASRESKVMSTSDYISTGFASNISSPQQFTRNINPYNPYFPPIPTRQPSSSSTRSQSLALSSHPTPAIPKLVIGTTTESTDGTGNVQVPAEEPQVAELPSSTPGFLGYRQNSALFSPDSADPSRDSMGLNPKVVVTPNRTPGGDLVLTVDTTGKGYGI